MFQASPRDGRKWACLKLQYLVSGRITMQRVEIRVRSHLDENWTERLDGFTLTHTEQDETVLTGKIKDQAALYGMMAKLRDLGVSLIAVNFKANEDGFLEEDNNTVRTERSWDDSGEGGPPTHGGYNV
jgi:hypothetical protein